MNKFFYAVLLISGIFISACDDTSTNIDNEEIPDSNVSFSKHIQPIFNAKCVSCHGVGTTEGEVNLTTWSGTMTVVFPNEPDNSRLVWVIELNPGIPHPQFPYLTAKQINGVRTWIEEGAENN
jgi:hypothetical protein